MVANDLNIEDENLYELNDDILNDTDVAELTFTKDNVKHTYTSEIGYLRRFYSDFGEWEIEKSKNLKKPFSVNLSTILY